MAQIISRKDETKLQNARRLIDQVMLNLTLLKSPKGWTERQSVVFNVLTTAELVLGNVVSMHDTDFDMAEGLREHLEAGLRSLGQAPDEGNDSSFRIA